MHKCKECKRSIPAELTNPMITSEGTTGSICGVCALNIKNAILGLNDTEFQGEIAEDMRQQALEHYKRTGQL